MLKPEIEDLNLELGCKTDEQQQIKFVKEIESEISYLINIVLINIDNADDVSEKLLILDDLINKVTSKLLDVSSIC